ncbi:kinase domain-containing protein [Fusarium pseudoanthophilum]|uniref:Kinase domain-containing protein n=1 Tax=Fusarium pseudoanthophilum TaxID=48495 RepID=A0A8H5PML2_9HYPO|nr:kinase domain-containing protein [Fusarium pseudoanthophilum]
MTSIIELTSLGFSGSPHPTPSKNDPLHASVALRKKENLKGSGLSLHIYPNGTVVPSKEEFPVATMTAATAEELGAEHAQWLDPDFVAQWQAENDAKLREKPSGRKGESEGKGESSRGSSSKKHGGSAKHSSSSGKGKGKASGSNEYSVDESTGTMYRYLENGAVVYYDPNSKREYYYDEHGQAVWL